MQMMMSHLIGYLPTMVVPKDSPLIVQAMLSVRSQHATLEEVPFTSGPAYEVRCRCRSAGKGPWLTPCVQISRVALLSLLQSY